MTESGTVTGCGGMRGASARERRERKIVDREFPETEQPNWLPREALEQAAITRSRSSECVSIARERAFALLDAHAAGSRPPMVLTGESGSGKSALLANCSRQRAVGDDSSAPFVIEHHVGASTLSAGKQFPNWAAFRSRQTRVHGTRTLRILRDSAMVEARPLSRLVSKRRETQGLSRHLRLGMG